MLRVLWDHIHLQFIQNKEKQKNSVLKMAPKRKMEITAAAFEENERSLHALFHNVANNLSRFYSHSVNNQKLAFEAGEKYAFLKLHEWILEKLQDGKKVTVPEILIYVQGKLSVNMLVDGEQGEGGSGSGQNNGMQSDVASSSSVQDTQNEDGYHDMQMDFTLMGVN